LEPGYILLLDSEPAVLHHCPLLDTPIYSTAAPPAARPAISATAVKTYGTKLVPTRSELAAFVLPLAADEDAADPDV